MRTILFLFSLLSLVSAVCDGQVSYYIPAVVGEDGGLVNVTMALAPGPGDVYVSIVPQIGVSTQESIEDAVEYAKRISNSTEECDVYVNFPDKSGNLIDGPSGGASFSVMAYALFNGMPIRNDTMITGTVDRFGNVGAVGGLYEKANSAATIGARYFITPKEDIYETFLLGNIKDRLNITVLQTANMDDIIGFMFYNGTIENAGIESQIREIPILPYYDYSGISKFKTVAERMIDIEGAGIANMPEDDNESVVVKEFFENELARQNAILESGYLFTAANEAFLDYIDLSTIVAMEAGDADLDDKVGEINGCFAGITRPEMTDTNFEWVVGADLRQNWAEDKLEATETENLLEEEKYVAYNELMYAQAWCEVAKGLVEAADTEGEVINEGIWKKIAEQKISDAKEMPVLDSELEDRLDIAEKAYNDGKYGAAIYDAAFVIAQSQQVPDEPDLSIVNESRTSLWGQVYQAHAVYFYFQNQTSAAYTTALLAKELDEATADMRDAINAQEITPQTTIQLDYYLLAAIGLMFLFIVAVGIIWRSHGNNGPRYRKTHRIGQKKG